MHVCRHCFKQVLPNTERCPHCARLTGGTAKLPRKGKGKAKALKYVKAAAKAKVTREKNRRALLPRRDDSPLGIYVTGTGTKVSGGLPGLGKRR